MVIIKEYETDPQNRWDERSIQDTPVYSSHHEYVGRIAHLIIDQLVLAIDSIVVTDGITKEPIQIGKEFIGRSSPEQITLTVEPSKHWIEKSVFDNEARYVGTVVGVHLRDDTQDYLSLIIHDNQTDQEHIITEKDIHRIGKYILLSTSIRS
jgi:sporulation protein YlmC with PRC-barrel domain